MVISRTASPPPALGTGSWPPLSWSSWRYHRRSGSAFAPPCSKEMTKLSKARRFRSRPKPSSMAAKTERNPVRRKMLSMSSCRRIHLASSRRASRSSKKGAKSPP